jgi:hypothetical protein
MRPTLNDQCEAGRRLLKAAFVVAAVSALFLGGNLRADTPEKNMANLKIEDQGTQMVVSWHFFYYLLPQNFVLHEMQDEPMALDTADSHLLEKNLSDFVLSAFEVTVDGRTVQPTLLSLSTYPNKSCLAFLSYPGHPHSTVKLEAPVLQYFSPNYFLGVSVTSTTGKRGGFIGKGFARDFQFVQGDIPRAPTKPLFSKDFIAEWGAAWVNYNWILSCLVLLLMRQMKQIALLIGSIVVCWILLCLASTLFDYRVPCKIPQIALGIVTVLLCILGTKYPQRFVLLTLVTMAAGALNAGYDIQQIPLTAPAQTVNALVGLAAGFAGGIAVVLVVVVPLWWECRKYPGFEQNWAPKICWGVAAIAVLLPIHKWIFG